MLIRLDMWNKHKQEIRSENKSIGEQWHTTKVYFYHGTLLLGPI